MVGYGRTAVPDHPRERTSALSDITELHRRLLKAGPPRRPGRRELVEELGHVFGTTEVPLALLSGEFDAGAEGIVEGRDVLLSITDARRLDAIAVDDERENVYYREDLEEELASADAETDPADRLYSRTLVEHGAGLRTSVLLRGDADPEEVAGYAVHGVLGGVRLETFLAVRLGVPDMRLGDLTDESFTYYLELLAADGRI